MSKKKIKMSKIDINHKFSSYEEALKHAKKLKSYIGYMCKNNNYKCEAMIGISCLCSKLIDNNGFYYEKTGNVGKPKIIRDIITDDDKIIEINGQLGKSGLLGNVYTDYHLHVLLVSYPGETIRLKNK